VARGVDPIWRTALLDVDLRTRRRQASPQRRRVPEGVHADDTAVAGAHRVRDIAQAASSRSCARGVRNWHSFISLYALWSSRCATAEVQFWQYFKQLLGAAHLPDGRQHHACRAGVDGQAQARLQTVARVVEAADYVANMTLQPQAFYPDRAVAQLPKVSSRRRRCATLELDRERRLREASQQEHQREPCKSGGD